MQPPMLNCQMPSPVFEFGQRWHGMWVDHRLARAPPRWCREQRHRNRPGLSRPQPELTAKEMGEMGKMVKVFKMKSNKLYILSFAYVLVN